MPKAAGRRGPMAARSPSLDILRKISTQSVRKSLSADIVFMAKNARSRGTGNLSPLKRSAVSISPSPVGSPTIYDLGFHTPDSLARKSFEVLETLPTEEQPIDCVPLLAQGRLPLEGCVQQEKSPDLPRVMQINGVEQRVTKMPRYLGGLTAQVGPLSSPRPDEGEIVKEGENVDAGEMMQFDIIKQKPLVDVDLNFPPVEEKIRNPEIKKGDCNQSPSACASSSVTHVKLSSWKGFEELGMDPENTGIISDLKRFKLTGSCLLKFVDDLLLSRGDERIIVFTTNNRDLLDAALRCPFNKDNYILKSSPQPVALPAEGEIVQLNSFEQKPLVDFDATNSRAHQRSVFVSNPENKNTREISKGQCMTESVCSLIDSTTRLLAQKKTTRISSTDFDAPDNKAHLLRAHQSSPIVFNSEKKDTIEGLRGECLTKNVPSLDDSRKQKSMLDFDATKNKAHLFRAYQIDPVVSLSENKNRGEALKSNVQSLLGLEDLQQLCGDRRDAAAKTLSGIYSLYWSIESIYDPGFHTPDSLAWKSFEVLETLPAEEQPIDCVPLLSQGRLPLEGCVRQEKSPDLPRVMQINGVERRVTKMPSYLRGLTTQSASSSRSPISLPDGGHIVLLDLITKNIEHVARADQCSPTVFLAEKKMVRKHRTMSVIFEENHLHFGRRCEGAAKSLGAMRICGKHGINQKWATRKGYSLGDSLAWKSFKVQDNLPLGEQSNTRRRSLTHKHCVRLKKSQDLPRSMLRDCAGGLAARSDIGLPDGGHILSLSEKKIVRKTLKRKCRTMSVLSLEDHQQHVGRRWEDTVKFLGAKRVCRQLVIHRETTAKRIRRQLGTCWWLFKQSAIGLPDGGHILYLPEKKIFRKTLKRKCRSISVLSLEDHKQHVVRRWEDAAKSHGTKCIRRQLVIHRLSTAKRTHKGIHQWPFQRSVISLPDGGHILSLSEKKIVRKTLKRKCRSMSVLCLVDRQQHVDRRWEDAAKNIGAKRICRQLVIHRVSIAKRICRQHGIHHRWPFERDWATMKGYSLGDERPVEVISLSTHAKLVLRLQLIYISWLGSFSPRLSALPGREILGPIALSSSEFTATKNIAQRVGQDRSGSASSDSENERTRDQEDPREIYTSITKDDLLQLYGRMNRKDAAASLGVGRPPDQHGERNTSTACKTPLHNVHARMEGEPVGQNQDANEFRRDFVEHSVALNTENDSIIALYSETEAARGSSKWAFQLEDQTMQSTTYPYCDDLVFSQSQIASTEVVNENMGSLQDGRDLLASQVVAPQKEPLLEGHVFGFGNWTAGSCSDLASSHTMRTFSHATGSSENLENWLASVEEHLMEEHIYGSSMSDPAPSQPMCTIHHSMATIPHMMPLPTERQDTRSVKLKATYGDTKIKFQFPLTSGINELKEVMSKILERELGSFKVEYKDEDGEWILMALDEHVREYLQLLNSLGNKATELKVQDKVPNTTNFCANCRCYNRRPLKQKDHKYV
ncbi:hypothetical protein RHMOL_Rhmol05G0027100 [Rhododendron molle]|uniref:Uncharacterized protein n=1 Tax=Rhododendron molle TaxID=49168 RepID=A0ACC0NM66_RHOML|nr:hypothetical protein RHMOL_Rhmol05G0027100 [Rhododendron molle]